MSEARVLIIEDNDALRVVLFTVLRHQPPLAVDTATCADEAIEKVRNCDYALILLDMDLPDDDSEEFLRRFRDLKPDATSFIMAVRNPRDDRILEHGMVSAIVNKPLEIDTLVDVVRECALVVPPPDDPLPCPPSESDIKSRMERDDMLPN